MAKMNSSGASESRLVPPGSCNQNANPLCIPDKMITDAKSIPCNKITTKYPINRAP